ncbi:putative ALA-interacting subunit 2 [Amborella trichopoda]|nr:putative ALA-interacting subunit 2 [Amborella trichopoda]XP_011620771.1 putative ALA-interacting subunit 2 [Amborella trichopoda]XP_020518663.1 putative ALA-interacting subunit 2 [Amborella trichopoda]|eukprot:XP_006836332.2 putative ALA-interacting subunit 2 [Amborella trichopoda]
MKSRVCMGWLQRRPVYQDQVLKELHVEDRSSILGSMDNDEASTSGSNLEIHSGFRNTLHSSVYGFTQQNLPACKPVLTPGWVITMFLSVGFICIPIGVAALLASQSVVEIVDRYDTECIPEVFRDNKVAYIKDDSISKNCTRILKVPSYMKAPIYVYYQLDSFYQNHRRYVKSRSDRQLLYGLKYTDTASCKPEETGNGLPIVPCGLVAWSLFNDTYNFVHESVELKVNRKNIAWKSDREHKFGKDVYPFNFQNGSLIGGAKLDPQIPLSEQEDLMVWMRTAALPSFRKLYGVIEIDLDADEILTVFLSNNYNTYSFGGKKRLVLSTKSWLGGKNNFLAVACLAVGSSCIFMALLFVLLHVRNPRTFGDPTYLTLDRKSNFA